MIEHTTLDAALGRRCVQRRILVKYDGAGKRDISIRVGHVIDVQLTEDTVAQSHLDAKLHRGFGWIGGIVVADKVLDRIPDNSLEGDV